MIRFLPAPVALTVACLHWGWLGVLAGPGMWGLQFLIAVACMPTREKSREAFARACEKQDKDVASLLLIAMFFAQAFLILGS